MSTSFLINNVNNKSLFICKIINLCIGHEACIEIWGNLSSNIKEQLKPYKVHVSLMRRIFFKEHHYIICEESKDFICKALTNHILCNKSFGIIISNEPFLLFRTLNDIVIDSCSCFDTKEIEKILFQLKLENIIKNYEILKD